MYILILTERHRKQSIILTVFNPNCYVYTYLNSMSQKAEPSHKTHANPNGYAPLLKYKRNAKESPVHI